MSSEIKTKKLNWATELRSGDTDNKQIAKVREKERELIAKGYRWYSISSTYKVLIPCDKCGHPTKEGLEKIQKHKEMLNVV